jgi:hypothetical protein
MARVTRNVATGGTIGCTLVDYWGGDEVGTNLPKLMVYLAPYGVAPQHQ